MPFKDNGTSRDKVVRESQAVLCARTGRPRRRGVDDQGDLRGSGYGSGLAWCRFGQAVEQDAPLRVNDAGLAVLPVWLAWKPMVTEALGAIAAL